MGPKIALLLLAIALAGCASTKATPISDPKSVWCESNEPERYTADERAHLTDQRKKESLAHNLKGAAWCGWQP